MSYSSLLPLLQKTGSSLSVEEFQSRINVVFHDHEAFLYDSMHEDMWESLQEQINLLANDLSNFKAPSSGMRLLDIGCGTGLSTQQLLHSKLGEHIDHITLLDTSPNMLKLAEKKAKSWGKKYVTINSEISDLEGQYDIIMVCSVLHHIPELDSFLERINNLLVPGGVLIHLQDPNGDYLQDLVYLGRVAEYQRFISASSSKKLVDFIPKNWKHFINRKLGRKNYIDHINDQLLSEKVIHRRMTAEEIWSVTDIHVENKTDVVNKGISARLLKDYLKDFTLINQRSYAFYGVLKSDLSEELKKNEHLFISRNELNGRNISCIWIKN